MALNNFTPSGVQVLDIATVHPGLSGFSSGFAAGHYAYFVPYFNQNQGGSSGLVAKVDLDNYTVSGVQMLDLKAIDPALVYFSGGFSDGRYAYLVPRGPGNGSGKTVRVDLTDFSASGVQVLDLTTVDPALKGFEGGFADTKFAYFVPGQAWVSPGVLYSGKLARIALDNFTPSGVTAIDLLSISPDLAGFADGFAMTGYGYLVPGSGSKLARLSAHPFRQYLPAAANGGVR